MILLLESLDYGYVRDEASFQRILPRIHARHKQWTSFERHFAVWPFSTKSLHSFICGDYPLLSTVMQIRVAPDKDCGAWSKRLRKSGYHGWAGYSGRFNYDRMGTFLKSQGFETLVDREVAGPGTKYESNSWGLDDRALFDSFTAWIDSHPRKRPFMALSIPINSHHPCWTPAAAARPFQDECENAFHYQDALVEEYVRALEGRDLLNSTVVIITSDHGRPSVRNHASGTLLEDDFHVPLWILDPTGTFRAGERVQSPTSHVELKGALYKMTGLEGAALEGQDLSGRASVFLFSLVGPARFMLLKKDQSLLLNLDEPALYRGAAWVENLLSKCQGKDCRSDKSDLFLHMSHAGRPR